MNLWTVGEVSEHNYDDELHWIAFWSWGSDEAVDYWRRSHPEQYHIDEAAYSTWIETETDGIPKPDSPRPVRNSSHLRLLGWRCPGDAQCESCGLYSMDGRVPVCEECYCCKQCGCVDDCPARMESEQ